jgi:formiminoglutamase
MHEDPRWPRAGSWLAGDCLSDPLGRIVVAGAPLNSSITPGRCDLAPAAIRRALQRFSPYDLERDNDLRQLMVEDLGDLPLSDLTPEEAFGPIRNAVFTAEADAVILLGGDNGITRPAVNGLCDSLERVGLLTLDAHLDMRDTDGGLHNGNPVRALLEDGLNAHNIVQIGIQAFANSAEYAKIAQESGIEIITAEQALAGDPALIAWEQLENLSRTCDRIYVDIDLDVLDRSFSPATPGSRPGGFMPWQLRQCAYVCGLHPKVAAVDLVEIDPTHDLNDSTALTAAACLLCFASGVLERLT